MPMFKFMILAVDYWEIAAIALPRNNIKKNETKCGNYMFYGLSIPANPTKVQLTL